MKNRILCEFWLCLADIVVNLGWYGSRLYLWLVERAGAYADWGEGRGGEGPDQEPPF